MKIDLRTYIPGGEVTDPALKGGSDGRVFTRMVETSDIVLIPHEAGDLIAAWAAAMCMRDALLRVEGVFPNFVYEDRLVSGAESRMIKYTSPLAPLHWWNDRLSYLTTLEMKLVAGEYVGLAVDVAYGLVLIQAVEWFVKRHRCRPPGLAEGSGVGLMEIDGKTEIDSGAVGDTGQQLTASERKSVESLRDFEASNLDFLQDFTVGEVREKTEKPPEGMEANNDVFDRKNDSVDQQLFGYLDIARAQAPDGFRKEDKQALERFRNYVRLAADAVPPLRARWLDKRDLELGQQFYSFYLLLLASSFPNADAAKLREEELAAERARKARIEAAQKNGGVDQFGGTAARE